MILTTDGTLGTGFHILYTDDVKNIHAILIFFINLYTFVKFCENDQQSSGGIVNMFIVFSLGFFEIAF